jgi:hypothetical protein
VAGNDWQANSRLGATIAFPVDRYNSIKLNVSSGVSLRTGTNFDAVGIFWQHRWFEAGLAEGPPIREVRKKARCENHPHTEPRSPRLRACWPECTFKKARIIMIVRPTRFVRALAASIIALALCIPLGAAAQSADDDWKFAITPYLWLPNINATLKYSVPPGTGGSPEVEVGPNDYLTNLNAVLMLAGEARKGRWSLFTDFVYLDISAEGSSVKSVDFGGTSVTTTLDAGTKTTFKGMAWTLGGGYAIVQTPGTSLDLIGGVRYFGLHVTTDWNLSATIVGPPGSQSFPTTGSVSEDADLWDAIIGARGRIRLGEGHWSVPYYLDAGTGSSSFTWQGLLGVAYTFGWGDVTLAYRYLYYDEKNGKLIQDLSFNGPALGATFRF